jgi:hypothetical protein
MSTVVIFGAGAIGDAVLRAFASYREISTIWVFDIEERRLEVAAADAAAIATLRESFTKVRYRKLDLLDQDEVADVLSKLQADLIVNTATLQSPWALNALDSSTREKLELGARFGPWIPVNLVLPLKLMRALSMAGLATPVINVSFPDGVNAVLGSMGLPPTCGAGNSDLLVAGIKPLVAERVGIPVGEVEVFLCAHHFHVHLFTSGLDEVESLEEYPYYLRVLVRGRDVTDELGRDELVSEAGRRMPKNRASAATAESAVKNGLRLLRDDPTLTHVPGPDGRAGGFDVRLKQTGVEIVWPEEVSAEKIQEMHARAQQGDGIQEISPGGIVTFTEPAHETMRDVLGYDCRVLQPDEFEDRAKELIRRVRERVENDPL